MGETTTLPAPPARRHDEWLDRRWRLTGAAIALAVLAVALVALLTGAQRVSFGSLLGAVADGDVSQVEVVGRVDDTNWSGERTIEVRWHRWWDRYAEVTVVRGTGSQRPSDGTYVTNRDPREVLLGVDPDLVVVDATSATGSSWTVADWRTQGAVAMVAMTAWLAVLLLLVGGPEPRRATRWAWFWIWLLGTPVGAIAFLLLGGPLARGPLSPSRRLTGGWAFLATFLLLAGWRDNLSP